MEKLELNGWKQVSKQKWTGSVFTDTFFPTQAPHKAKIEIKKASRIARNQSLRILVYTSYGHESSRADTMEEALERVKWFMERRPQNEKDAYTKQGFRVQIGGT